MADRWRSDSLRVLRARLPARCADAVQIEQRGALFIATLRLEQSALTVEGKAIPLSPGMNLTAEVKTGSRRAISYLLNPIQQHADGERPAAPP